MLRIDRNISLAMKLKKKLNEKMKKNARTRIVVVPFISECSDFQMRLTRRETAIKER